MDNLDFLFLLTSRLDNSALQVLSHTPFWNSIKSFSTDQYWWYLRVQYLLDSELTQRLNIDWKILYPILLESMEQDEESKFTEQVLSNPLAVQVLIEAGYDPSEGDNHAIIEATEMGEIETVKILLADERVDPDSDYDYDNEYYPLVLALDKQHFDIAKLLIADPRVDLSRNDNYAIRTACDEGYAEIVELLLAHEEVQPEWESNYVMRHAASDGHAEVVKLLLSDTRVDPADEDNEAIIQASGNGHLEVVKLLLADSRVDPTAGNNEAIRRACAWDNVHVVKLLLSDPRVDPADEDNAAIGVASQRGHPEVVKLLLADPRVDPAADDNYALIYAASSGRVEVVRLLLADGRADPNASNNGAVRLALDLRSYGVLELLLDDPRTQLPQGGRPFIYDKIDREAELLRVLTKSRAVDLQSLDDPRTLGHILTSIYPYLTDSLDGCVMLSGGKFTEPRTILSKLVTTDYERDYYYIFLRELILKSGENGLELAYFFKWLVEQCKRHADALEYRRVIAAAAKSYRDTGIVRHTSPLFTAYSGFLLLAKSSIARAILALLSSEGASQEGLLLAGMLIGAYLGNRRL